MRIETARRRFFAVRRPLVLSVAMMTLLMLGQGAYWAGGLKWLAHALDHGNAGPALALEEHHGHIPEGNGDPLAEPFTDVEHELLHEVEHIQPIPLSFVPQRVPFIAPATVALVARWPAQRPSERTFRPPRPS